MPIRAVLFDLDGVLVDSQEVWFQVLRAVARELGYSPVERDVFLAGWGQGIEADRERFFPRETTAELQRRFDAAFDSHLAHLRFDPHGPAVLGALRARGVPSALVTNSSGPLARTIVARGGLVLDAVVGGDEVARAKPAPDVVLCACERVRVAPAQALVVGDTEFDRAAAAAAGAGFAGLRFGAAPVRRIERLDEVLALVDGAA